MELLGVSLIGLGYVFWGVLIVAFLIVAAMADNEKYGRSIGLLIIFAVVLLFLSGHTLGDAWHWIADNPRQTMYYVLGYLGIGLAYGTLRWVLKLFRIRKKLIAFRADNKLVGPLTSDDRKTFLNSVGEGGYGAIPPRVRDNKARITFWMTFWPISLPISLRPITRLIEYLYDTVAGLLQSISNRMFRDIA